MSSVSKTLNIALPLTKKLNRIACYRISKSNFGTYVEIEGVVKIARLEYNYEPVAVIMSLLSNIKTAAWVGMNAKLSVISCTKVSFQLSVCNYIGVDKCFCEAPPNKTS